MSGHIDWGFSAAVVVVVYNLPLGLILFEMLKVVNQRLALLALVFITASATLEAVHLFNYISPLFALNLPEYHSAFQGSQLQALALGPIVLWICLQREPNVLWRVLRPDRLATLWKAFHSLPERVSPQGRQKPRRKG